jgi:hypothetical protein
MDEPLLLLYPTVEDTKEFAFAVYSRAVYFRPLLYPETPFHAIVDRPSRLLYPTIADTTTIRFQDTTIFSWSDSLPSKPRADDGYYYHLKICCDNYGSCAEH